VKPVGELSEAERASWSVLREQDPLLANPFLSCDFATAVAEAGPAVEVALVQQEDRILGILPFQRTGQVGKPVGSIVSELQGIVARPGAEFDFRSLLTAANLRCWDYDGALAHQSILQASSIATREASFIDLEVYRTDQELATGGERSSWLKDTARKERKLAREVGSPRFVLADDPEEPLAALHRWKSLQYARTGTFNVLSIDWVWQLVQQLSTCSTDDLSGVCSTLYAGDRLLAVHFGILSRGVLASWFPAYDYDLGGYSPGLILLKHLIAQGGEAGVRRIDLGQGNERYKTSAATGSYPLCEGSVGRSPTERLARRAWVGVRDWAQSSPSAQRPLVAFRAARNWVKRHRQKQVSSSTTCDLPSGEGR